jgi:2-octaprenyl-6-methoxyphenol hydroxylase
VVEYDALHSALREALADRGIEPLREAPGARCEVHAEGWSEAAEKGYGQDAIVALVDFDPPAASTAHERFTAHGPLALLPHSGSYALIWSTQPALAQALAAATETRFVDELAAALGSGTGRPIAARARSVQPLALRVRDARVEGRAVYIGNAAQTLHPVAGQGLNLGLRDAWELAQILRGAVDPGAPEVLARFGSRRRLDAQATIRVTDALARAFLGAGRAAGLARGVALTLLDVLPAPRRFFARRMIYGASAWP